MVYNVVASIMSLAQLSNSVLPFEIDHFKPCVISFQNLTDSSTCIILDSIICRLSEALMILFSIPILADRFVRKSPIRTMFG